MAELSPFQGPVPWLSCTGMQPLLWVVLAGTSQAYVPHMGFGLCSRELDWAASCSMFLSFIFFFEKLPLE